MNPIISADLPPCLQHLCENILDSNNSDNVIKMDTDDTTVEKSDIESNSTNIDIQSIPLSTQELTISTTAVRTYVGFEFLGALLTSDVACGIADGFIDPCTLVRINMNKCVTLYIFLYVYLQIMPCDVNTIINFPNCFLF